jgi:hypothetical protein
VVNTGCVALRALKDKKDQPNLWNH